MLHDYEKTQVQHSTSSAKLHYMEPASGARIDPSSQECAVKNRAKACCRLQ